MENDLPRDLGHPRRGDHALLASVGVGVFLLALLGTLVWFYLVTLP